MKYTFLLVNLLLVSSLSFSQIKKGNLFVSGGFDFSFYKHKDKYESSGQIYLQEHKMNKVSFSPYFGYFISDKISIGMSLKGEISSDIITTTQLVDPTNKAKTYTYLLLPFVKTFFPISERFAIYAELKGGYGQSNTYRDYPTQEEWKSREIHINMGPGLAFFPNKKWSLELQIGSFYFESYKDLNETFDEPVTNAGGFDFNFTNPTFAVSYYLGKE